MLPPKRGLRNSSASAGGALVMENLEPLDSGDFDALLEIERSAGYSLIAGRIAYELNRRREELEADSCPETTAFIRGQINALKIALEIPAIMRAEIKGQVE